MSHKLTEKCKCGNEFGVDAEVPSHAEASLASWRINHKCNKSGQSFDPKDLEKLANKVTDIFKTKMARS